MLDNRDSHVLFDREWTGIEGDAKDLLLGEHGSECATDWVAEQLRDDAG